MTSKKYIEQKYLLDEQKNDICFLFLLGNKYYGPRRIHTNVEGIYNYTRMVSRQYNSK